ncbi:hypothetical protein ACL2XO_18465 [Sodalis sp. RH15]|uniref:hypothetical protein n=1 Tax=Sodalis sp. RH15 TaxID=3394330 RepID=UPI0039B38A40
MIRFLCCRHTQNNLTTEPVAEAFCGATQLKTISNHHTLASFPKTTAGMGCTNVYPVDQVEWSPPAMSTSDGAPSYGSECLSAQGVVVKIKTYPARHASTCNYVPSKKIINRTQSFNVRPKKSDEPSTPLSPHVSPAGAGRPPRVKRTVSFNLPAEKSAADDKTRSITYKSIEQGQLLLASIENHYTEPEIKRLLGQDGNPGELSNYDPLMQLMIFKTLFRKVNIKNDHFFAYFFSRCVEISCQWSEYFEDVYRRDTDLLEIINRYVLLEIPRDISTLGKIQPRGELWLKFYREQFNKVPPKTYILICREFFNTRSTFRYEYQIEIISNILKGFRYIPQVDNEEVFLKLTKLCTQHNPLVSYEYIKLLAENVKYLAPKLRYQQALAIKNLSISLDLAGQGIIHAILRPNMID